jgi:hypothetical protein
MAVCVESYRAWLSTEARTDDITVIVIEVELGRGLRWGTGVSASWSRHLTLSGCCTARTVAPPRPASYDTLFPWCPAQLVAAQHHPHCVATD